MGIFNPKLILIALAVWLGFALFKKMRKPKASLEQDVSANKKMLGCCVCRVHVPQEEAIIRNGKVYCSQDCL